MEPCETENCLTEGSVLVDSWELGDVTVKSQHVRPDTLWWLLRNLDRSLKKGDGEVWMWVGRKNKFEVWIDLLWVLEDTVNDRLKLWKELDRQVAVSKEHPVSGISSFGNVLLSLLALSLTHGQGIETNTLLLGKLSQVVGWIDTWTQDEDDWLGLSGLIEDLLDIGWSIFDEIFLHVSLNIVSDGKVNSVSSEASENDHLLKLSFQFGLPLTWKLSLFWWVWLDGEVPSVPLFVVELDSVGDTGIELWKCLLKLGEVVPSSLGDPIEWRLGRLSGSVKDLTTSQEECPLVLIDQTISHLKFDAHLHGK